MPSYTYPVKHPEGTLTTEQIHALLSNARVIAKRVATLIDQKFIADYLLVGRYNADGGGIYYETGEEIFAADAPESVAPGAEYPKTILTQGDIASAKTVKWGIETDITDEKIKREGITVVNKALVRLGNTILQHVDSVAWGVIASKVTSTAAAAEAWTTAGKIYATIETLRSTRAELGIGLDLDTIALSGPKYAKLVGLLIDDKAFPREAGNPLQTRQPIVDLFGYTWVTSPHITGNDPWLIDRNQLGGMADEKLGSPGYASAGQTGVETLAQRAKADKYEVRGRRVTVPVVMEPMAGVRITGTGL